VYTAATLSSMIGRQARVEVGPALRIPTTRRGPLAEVELAEQLQHRLQVALDELGPMDGGMSVPGLGLISVGRAR